LPAASAGEVHVWALDLDQPDGAVSALARDLTPEERLRADRFHFERDRRRFVAGRGFLRGILGRYLGVEPGRLVIGQAAHGKPVLAAEHGDAVRFNLTHSGGRGLLAVACGREVGIDLEQARPLPDALAIGESFFSPRENAVLRGLPPGEREQAFLNCWTRKEAFLKATGKGLLFPMDQLEVSLAPGEPAELLSLSGDRRIVARWRLDAFAPFPGYVAALAVEGWDWQPRFWCCPVPGP
jgi:4'-phosphopantetheinyl transferase